ncbi:sigma factor [Kitasatospora sp. NPDC098663]|uniref:sigma factor n=1 Tax=Kitasatospora sp. NPDC098663 TaxID=3364096 RepID=UPI00380F37C6
MRVADGDPRAFDQLHDAIGAALFLIVLRVVRDRGHTQDVVQEVLLEIWRKAHHFQPARGTARVWIAIIARRRAIDRVRTGRAVHERDLRAALLERPAPVDHISEHSASLRSSGSAAPCFACAWSCTTTAEVPAATGEAPEGRRSPEPARAAVVPSRLGGTSARDTAHAGQAP